MRRAVLAVAASMVLSCGTDARRTTRSEDQNATLGGDVAARVGSQAIALSVVARVAEAQNVPPPEALRKLVDDEIAASAARAQGREQRDPTSWRLVSTRARFTADQFAKEARALGPPTDEEVNLLSARHWIEVDRPPTIRVEHALVMRPKDAALLEAARRLAGELRTALVPTSNEEFLTKAKAFPHEEKLVIHVDPPLPAFTEDGRVAEGGGQMDPAFAKGAFAIASDATTSPVVESSFGFHVIRLLERIPEKRMPFENRRLAFTDEVYVMRARERMNARVKALRTEVGVSVSPAAEQLMRTVKVTHESTGTGAP